MRGKEGDGIRNLNQNFSGNLFNIIPNETDTFNDQKAYSFFEIVTLSFTKSNISSEIPLDSFPNIKSEFVKN